MAILMLMLIRIINGTDGEELNLKLHSAFEGVKCFPFKTIIFQFWRPTVSDRGRPLLESFRNADAFPPLRLLYKYRVCSTRYHYSLDDGGGDVRRPDWIISGGPVIAAFLNHYPEVVLDMRALSGSPLVDVALECDLTCCVMLPVFYASSSECLGVVECSMKRPSLLLPVFNEMKRELEKVGMSIYHVQGSWPYTAISRDLEPVKVKTEKALKMACETHRLTIGQVWTLFGSGNDQMLLVNLGRYSTGSVSPIRDFYDKLDAIPLKRGEGLLGKALQTYQPHLCRNICKLSDGRGLLALLSSDTKCASFVICLRSPHTGDRDYLFEFFWPRNRNHMILLETLLLTLNKYLPNFKLVSGKQLGDELLVVDADSSGYVKVSQGNEASNELRTVAGMKRKSIAGQSDSSQSNLEVDDLAILATYRNETLLLDLPRSSTFENVMEKLKEEFELDPTRTYKVVFEVSPSRWSSLVSFESLKSKEGMDLIKLCVRAEGKEVGWRWITSTEG
ncbi:protein NLP6-like [Bidens hawaiensis]|uniref:protein NLP6-like n=1 Tax=Bidens hawaiensis TaxID=980011 RepID=UPI0040491C9B